MFIENLRSFHPGKIISVLGTEDENLDFHYLENWGPRFNFLTSLYVQDKLKPKTTATATTTPNNIVNPKSKDTPAEKDAS